MEEGDEVRAPRGERKETGAEVRINLKLKRLKVTILLLLLTMIIIDTFNVCGEQALQAFKLSFRTLFFK